MKKLSKSTLRKCWLRWMCGNLCSMSFQWLESLAFADSMAPAIKELYGGDKEKEAEASQGTAPFTTRSLSWAVS